MIVAIFNRKGGVGKTTTTVNLGACLVELGYDVALLDADIDQQDLTSFRVPGATLTTAESDDVAPLARAASTCDFVLIDCPPSLDEATVSSLRVADLVIVPVNSEYSAIRGLKRVLDTIAAARRGGNTTLKHKVLLTMFDTRSGHCLDIEAEAVRIFGPDLLQMRIKRTNAFSYAAQDKEPIIKSAPKSNGAVSYRALAEEIAGLGQAAGTLRTLPGAEREAA